MSMVQTKLKFQPGLKNYPYSKDMYLVCPICRKRYYDDDNITSINETGRCLSDDHIEGEEAEDRLKEHYENQESDDD